MNCRPHCGACCIALSISAAIPGMPEGKPAGVPCVNLKADTLECSIWETDQYPQVCRAFVPGADVCGESRSEAIRLIGELELVTRNGGS